MYSESRKHPARQLTVSASNLSVILHITACTFRRRRIVMPDHVHLFAAENELQGYPLGQWVAKWKAHVSRVWPVLKDQPIWQRSFWDHQLRDGDNYDAKWLYIRNNPVRHGLVTNPDDWPFQGTLNDLWWHDR